MRVLQVIEGEGGGAVTHVLNLSKQLKERGFYVIVGFITPGPSVAVAQKLELDCIQLTCRFFPDIFLIYKLITLIHGKRIDLIHTHTMRGNFYGRICSLLSSQPVKCVTTVHSFIIDELGGSEEIGFKDRLIYKRELFTRQTVEKFIVVSEKLKEKLMEEGVGEKNVEVITHGIEIPKVKSLSSGYNRIRKEFGLRVDEVVVGIIGRLVPVKNHALFLRAAKRVLDSVDNVKFLVVGDGYLRNDLEETANRLRISQSVIFIGWKNDINEAFKAIDMLVLCSTTETQGLVVLEALSFAKPVIATDINQISETVINGSTGVLVPLNDVTALSRAIMELAANSRLRRTLGRKGRDFVKKEYSLKNMADKTVNLYRDTLRRQVLNGDVV